VSAADPQLALRLRLRELAATRIAYGYRRLHVPLSHEGWQVNQHRRPGNAQENASPPCCVCQAGDSTICPD